MLWNRRGTVVSLNVALIFSLFIFSNLTLLAWRNLSTTHPLSIPFGNSIVSEGAKAQSAENLQNSAWFSKVSDKIEKQEYNITWDKNPSAKGFPAGYQAPNREQDFRTYFYSGGVQLVKRTNRGPDWTLSLKAKGINRSGYSAKFSPVKPVVSKNRVNYERQNITEWYINNNKGLEQGFTIKARPSGKGNVVLDLQSGGNVKPKLSTDGKAVNFYNKTGGVALSYNKLIVTDNNGRKLSSSMLVNGKHIYISYKDRGAAYPVEVDPIIVNPPTTIESNQITAMFGVSVNSAGDINGDGYSDVIVGAHEYDNGESAEGRAFVYKGSASGLSTSPDWTGESNQVGAYYAFSVSGAGDVNNDGFDDVIVGARNYGNGESFEGRAYVYFGSASGLSAVEDWSFESNQASTFIGYSVASAGDVNNDNYDDIVVGAPYYSNGEASEGEALVFHGSASGPSGTASWSVESNQVGAYLGKNAASAGDVNDDGYDDVVIGASSFTNGQTSEGAAYVYYGSASGLSASADWANEGNQAWALYGSSVSSAGDVNGDGYGDVLVGASNFDNGESNEGRAYLYLGADSGLALSSSWATEGNQADAELGDSASSAGDINGDGYSDIMIGAHKYSNGQSYEGRVLVYYGSPGGPSGSADWTGESDLASADYGNSVATAGDVNGDGYSDLVVGSQSYANGEIAEGRAYVYYGAASGLPKSYSWSKESNQVAALYGASVASAGDVNSDGWDDILIGAPYYDSGQYNEGKVFVFFGAASGIDEWTSWSAEGNKMQALFGYSVASAGDVNGDSYDDVAIGSPIYNGRGKVFVYHGGMWGLSFAPDFKIGSSQTGSRFGFSVAGAGDVNGDGFADLIVGSPTLDNGQSNEGRAYVYRGSGIGLVSIPLWKVEINQAYAWYGYSVTGSGDVNGDGYDDVAVGAPYYDNGQINEGAVYLYRGGAKGPVLTQSWKAEGNQAGAYYGFSVAGAGDVDGDGNFDVIAGAPKFDNGQVDEGKAFVYRGLSTSSLSMTASWSTESDQASAELGFSVASARDVNGDGYDDVMIGAPYFDNGQTDEGKAYVHIGSASGVSGGAPYWSSEGNVAASRYGYSVNSAGNVNGDEYYDILVGARNFKNGQSTEGKVYLYF